MGPDGYILGLMKVAGSSIIRDSGEGKTKQKISSKSPRGDWMGIWPQSLNYPSFLEQEQ